jgi:hypothetical protein
MNKIPTDVGAILREHPEISALLGKEVAKTIHDAFIENVDQDLLNAEPSCLSGMLRSGAIQYWLISPDGIPITEVGVDPTQPWWLNFLKWITWHRETVSNAIARCGKDKVAYVLEFFPGWKSELPPTITIVPMM